MLNCMNKINALRHRIKVKRPQEIKSTTRHYQDIHFIPLHTDHFPLLYKWINTPHVYRWWGENQAWSIEDIENKYSTYVNRYKLVDHQIKPIFPYIIQCKERYIGYIQHYNVHDFIKEPDIVNLPKLTNGFDLYIGEKDYIGKGVGQKTIEKFIHIHIREHSVAYFASLDKRNTTAIECLKRLGFQDILSNDRKDNTLYMLKDKEDLNPISQIKWDPEYSRK